MKSNWQPTNEPARTVLVSTFQPMTAANLGQKPFKTVNLCLEPVQVVSVISVAMPQLCGSSPTPAKIPTS